MDNGTVNIILTALIGVVITVLGFWQKRYIEQTDKRLEVNEHEVKEIKKNYNAKFQGIHDKVDQKVDQTKGELNEKIEETKAEILEEIRTIKTDKETYRFEQTKSMAVMETKIDMAVGMLKEAREDIKEMSRDNRDYNRNK